MHALCLICFMLQVAPCEQGSQELNCFSTSEAAKCQIKCVFVLNVYYILYLYFIYADQEAKEAKLTFYSR